MPLGSPGKVSLVLNIDSLVQRYLREFGWYLLNTVLYYLLVLHQSYTGGNPMEPASEDLPGIRQWIFHNGTGSRYFLVADIPS